MFYETSKWIDKKTLNEIKKWSFDNGCTVVYVRHTFDGFKIKLKIKDKSTAAYFKLSWC